MKSSKFAAVLAISAVVCSTAFAADDQQFSALAGVEAQAMSQPEMNAVYGQLTVDQIKAAISNVTQPPLTGILTAKLDAFVAAHPRVTTLLALIPNRGY